LLPYSDKPLEFDLSLYPDREPPIEWNDAERAEYVERLCRQFDFGIPIASRHVIALRPWKDVFDRFPLLDSPAYRAIRAYFGWERLQPRYRNATPVGSPPGNCRTSARAVRRTGQCGGRRS
jgi:hypothetical protein